ncbi:DUF5694 domain-containing protein [Metasolibacillus sp. FSL K6-0083]|uniref:DUF5694 domain-containing protein n=1 Tax=Metasolibacillus sp. FSL K6-0083 TaxID=2921416 RepID=UPI00315A75A2
MNLKKAKILVLGSFHMSEHKGLHSERRQTEIEKLVSQLASFNPTKIAVEMVPEESDYCNEKYKQYKLGAYKLEMNEIYQVGFRLGLKLGHERIFPTDWMGEADMEYREVESWAKENQSRLLNKIYEELPFSELSENKSVIDYYKELNTPTSLKKMHKMYVNIARIGGINNYIGIEWLSWWYKRNLIMFSNLVHLIDTEEERILFIVGSSHASIVTKFLEESEICEIIPPLSYIS